MYNYPDYHNLSDCDLEATFEGENIAYLTSDKTEVSKIETKTRRLSFHQVKQYTISVVSKFSEDGTHYETAIIDVAPFDSVEQ